MRRMLSGRLEQGRIRSGPYASPPGSMFGAFFINGPCGAELKLVADDGAETGWQHVSVSVRHRPPNWQEMAFVKDLFWAEDECVMQLHPPKADYINCHPYCLHLWKPTAQEIPRPPSLLVGPQAVNE